MRPVSTDNLSLLTSLLKDLEIVGMTNTYARELDAILRRPHIRVRENPEDGVDRHPCSFPFDLDDHGCPSDHRNTGIC